MRRVSTFRHAASGIASLVTLLVLATSCSDTNQDASPADTSRPVSTQPAGASTSERPEETSKAQEVSELADGLVAVEELANDWCVAQRVFLAPNDAPSFSWSRPILNQSGTSVFVNTGDGVAKLSAETFDVESTFENSFAQGYIAGSDWMWIEGRRTGGGLLLHDDGTTVPLQLDPQTPSEIVGGPQFVSSDGQTVAVQVFPDGNFDDLDPRIHTRIIDASSGNTLAYYEVPAVLFPNGELAAVPIIDDTFQQSGWHVEDVRSGQQIAQLMGTSAELLLGINAGTVVTISSDYTTDRRGEHQSHIYQLDTLENDPETVDGWAVSVSPDGRWIVVADRPGTFSDDPEDPEIQRLSVVDSLSGESLIGDLSKSVAYTGGYPFEAISSLSGLAAFSYDSRLFATWASSNAGEGVHVIDTETGDIVQLISTNSGTFVRFDVSSYTLHMTDRLLGQHGHIDLTNGHLLIGQALFSYLDYQRFAAANDVVFFYASNGDLVACDIRTYEDGPGDGSGPETDLPADIEEAVDLPRVLGAELPLATCQGIDEGSFVLSNGQHRGDDGFSRRWVEMDVEGQVAFEDLNMDGADDALFILTCNYGGNTNFTSLFLWLAGGEPEEVDLFPLSYGLGHAGGYLDSIQSVSTSGDLVQIRWMGGQRSDPFCCPSISMESVFRVTAYGHVHFLRNEAQNEESVYFERLLP